MKLKQIPEDFVVDEIARLPQGDGQYTYFTLWKKNLTTEEALERLNVSRKLLSCCGAKDKSAITVQYCSVKGDIAAFETGNLKVAVVGKGPKPLYLGANDGNRFAIVVRDLSETEALHVQQRADTKKFINLFGEQRFSTNNADVGKLLLQKKFKEAAELLMNERGRQEKAVAQHLSHKPHDYVGALQKIPQKILLLYLHAFQSKMWNAAALQLKDSSVATIPLPGFGTEFSGEAGAAVEELLQRENISQRDFIIPQLSRLSVEGDERALYADITNLEISEPEDDELNDKKKKVLVTFSLGKGSYATEVVRQILG